MIRVLFALFGAVAIATPFAQAAPPASAHPSAAPSAVVTLPPPAPVVSIPPPPLPDGKPGGAANPGPDSFDVGVWTVHASSLDANFKTGDFSTPAKVVMTRVGGDVTADRANGNYKKKVLYLNGHVVMHDSQGGAGAPGGDASRPSGPSTLTADKAQIDGTAKLYKAIGNVRYVQADTVVTADNGTLDDAAHNLLLEGAVHIVSGSRSMSASRVVYNTTSGDAHAAGNVTMQFPSAFHQHLATPKPLKVGKNPLTQPATRPSSPP